MASPPRLSPAGSPPYPSPSSLPNPRKRPLTLTTSSAPYPNKRKTPSFSATSSSHPLRQTSFPPEESLNNNDLIGGARSPSVSSAITAGTGVRSFTGVATGVGKKKRRGGKKGKDKERDKEEGGSVRSASLAGKGGAYAPGQGQGQGRGTREGSIGSRSRTGGIGGEDEGEVGEDEEEFGGGRVDLVHEGGKVDEAFEQRKMNVLIDAFNADQSDRYDWYRRVKLKPATVRRIVNQTLSQSVPPTVITSINGFAKVFLGTLVERARQIQDQQASIAERSLPTPPPTQEQERENEKEDKNTDKDSMSTEEDDTNNEDKRESNVGGFVSDFRKEGPVRARDGDLGPLLPDHVREAFRRFRQDGEGGGAGVEGRSVGLSLAGAATARLRGRRLFK